MKRLLVVIVLLLLLVVSCGSRSTEGTVIPETFIVVDRQTGEVYYPDLDPRPEIVGSTITFTQDGRAYILSGNWLIQGEINGN